MGQEHQEQPEVTVRIGERTSARWRVSLTVTPTGSVDQAAALAERNYEWVTGCRWKSAVSAPHDRSDPPSTNRARLSRPLEDNIKPYVICHMVASIDGRTLTSRWRPEDPSRRDFSSGCMSDLRSTPGSSAASPVRNTPSVTPIRIMLTSAIRGKPGSPGATRPLMDRARSTRQIALGRDDIGGDPIVVVLTEIVSDAHLAGLREDGVSYIFAGERAIDLGRALDTLNSELGIKRLEVNGGGSRTAPSFAPASSTRSAWRYSRPWMGRKAHMRL